MQMIADEAGINKALLHYYFRSKDKLFESVFELAFSQIIPPLLGLITSESTFQEFIRQFVNRYIDSIKERPFLPVFILHELQRNPERLVTLISDSGLDITVITERIIKEDEEGNIHVPNPRQLIVNLLSLCIFPFAARPLLQGVLFENDSQEYEMFLEERKEAVARFILDATLKKK
jgi:AcrR family transcriptional regulator